MADKKKTEKTKTKRTRTAKENIYVVTKDNDGAMIERSGPFSDIGSARESLKRIAEENQQHDTFCIIRVLDRKHAKTQRVLV